MSIFVDGMWSFAYLIVFAWCNKNTFVNGQLGCHSASSCEGITVTNSTTSIECWGSSSCASSSMSALGSNSIGCQASYSCYNARQLQTQSSSVGCNGLFSCAFIDNFYVGAGSIACTAELSCSNSRITIAQQGSSISCHGDRSCSNSTIFGDIFYIDGNLGVADSILHNLYDGGTFNLWGADSGYNTTIICKNGTSCDIICYSSACNHLTLLCEYGDDNCGFNMDCSYAEHSDNCPDGYYMSFDMVSLIDVSFSTHENSDLCSGSTIYAESYGYNVTDCGDYQECTSIVNSHAEAVCCTGSRGCNGASSVTSSNGGDIRCDGSLACDNIGGSILAENGGNIYLSGGNANDGSSTIIETTSMYDIICSGSKCCRFLDTIQNAMNLYCLGHKSCRSPSSLFENISNVFAYGWTSCHSTTMNNIWNSVYCNTHQSCYGSTITNVGDSIYGNGYQSLYGGQIANVSKVSTVLFWNCLLENVFFCFFIFSLFIFFTCTHKHKQNKTTKNKTRFLQQVLTV